MANDSFHPWRKAFFLEDPDCPTLVEMSKQPTKQQKFLAHTARGSRGISFFSFFLYLFFFILLIELFILLIEFKTLLRFLKTRASAAHTRTARVHCQVKSGPVSRSSRAAVRLCARDVLGRTTSSTRIQDAETCSRQVNKNIKKIEQNPEKRKKIRGPWPSLPSAVFAKGEFVEKSLGRATCR